MEEKTYYRIDARLFEVGDTITGEGATALSRDYPQLEDILERHRPPSCLGRQRCVYMCKLADIRKMGVQDYETKHCYELMPLTPAARRDVEWVAVLQTRHPSAKQNHSGRGKNTVVQAILENLEKKYSLLYGTVSDEEIAGRYWNGIPSEDCKYEYVTPEAEVVSIVKVPGNPLHDLINGILGSPR